MSLKMSLHLTYLKDYHLNDMHNKYKISARKSADLRIISRINTVVSICTRTTIVIQMKHPFVRNK